MKTDVVIPFITGPKDSIELRYALRSIEKNLQGDVRIWLYGERPEWIRNVRYVPVQKRIMPRYAKFLDQLKKIEFACLNPEIGARFIYTYDDVFFLKPLTVDQLNQPRALEDMAHIENWFEGTDAGANWVRCMKETLWALQRENLPIYNYETHLPRVYNKEKGLAILRKYNSEDFAFQFATMYFNNYETNPELLSENKFFKLGIYHAIGFRVLMDQVNQSSIMNIGEAAANDDSIRVLEAMFPGKSRYEK